MQYKTSRRTFVKGLVATGLFGGLGLWRSPVWALTSPGQPTVLAGTEFDLVIGETPVNITGSPRTALTINGTIPGPLLRWLWQRREMSQRTSVWNKQLLS